MTWQGMGRRGMLVLAVLAVRWHALAPRLPPAFAGLPTPRRQLSLHLGAIRSRAAALEILGLEDGLSDPSPEEVKRAFRKQAVQWHPDFPTGDASRFQEVREAYDLLTNKTPLPTTVSDFARGPRPGPGGKRVWDEGMPNGRADEYWRSSAPDEGKPDSRSFLNNLPYFLFAAFLAVVLVGINLPMGSIMSKPGDSTAGPSVVKSVPSSVALRGQDYVMMASIAGPRGVEIVPTEGPVGFAGPAPGAVGMTPKAQQLAEELLNALDETVNGEPKYRSISAIVEESDSASLRRVLKGAQGTQLEEPRYPYLFFQGRPVVLLERETGPDTRQELIIVTAFDPTRLSRSRMDRDFRAALEKGHPPDILFLDLSERDWRGIAGEYVKATGQEPWKGARLRNTGGMAPPAMEAPTAAQGT